MLKVQKMCVERTGKSLLRGMLTLFEQRQTGSLLCKRSPDEFDEWLREPLLQLASVKNLIKWDGVRRPYLQQDENLLVCHL